MCSSFLIFNSFICLALIGESGFLGDTGLLETEDDDDTVDDNFIDPVVDFDNDDTDTDNTDDLVALFDEIGVEEDDKDTDLATAEALLLLLSSTLAFLAGGGLLPTTLPLLLFSFLTSSPLSLSSPALIFPFAAVTGIFRFLRMVFFFMKMR